MGDALFDLEQVLRARRGQEKLTIQEANVLLAWRAQAMRDFTIGFGGGSIVTWLATPRLTNLFRINIALSAAAVCGLWRFSKSVESCVERVLSLEGSRIQRELATIMLKKYNNDPWVLQRLSKHFYSEPVFEDSFGDKPVFRWRFRNFAEDPIDHSESTSYHDEIDSRKSDIKRTTVEPKQVYVNAASDHTVENPFDLIFGLPQIAENIPSTDTDSILSRRQRRKEKRSRRRHRRHHQEEDSDD